MSVDMTWTAIAQALTCQFAYLWLLVCTVSSEKSSAWVFQGFSMGMISITVLPSLPRKPRTSPQHSSG
ncbi:hypothetical protein [Nodularia sp. UHCC 0506]|uniref:hypothetical protein n=1 Tax=Nodularia sp. UHCC 0506 TaxID=3110243 RepID=UPI002B1F5A51|nr:hypothetical protein [Nodularia sp. UHCC 0506]MEA5516727.1 hypothetical protein [Nodularia sp. UHCC 0506]